MVDVEMYVKKALRLKSPGTLSVQVRREIYEFISSLAKSHNCSSTVLIRGILEDFYDKYHDQEVQ